MESLNSEHSTLNHIRVFEAFAGYGSQAMALRRLSRDYPRFSFEVVGISEIDRYALQAYRAVHGDVTNYGDISKIDWDAVPGFDMLTYSFPCTDISAAGKQQGFSEGSGTRSSLLWECRKAILAKRPQWLLMENVKALVSEKFLPLFMEWEQWLASIGYNNYTRVLNAKDYGVPQNRERVFMVSTLSSAPYFFPKPLNVKCCLGDILEDSVDERYFLSQRMVDYIFSDSPAGYKSRGIADIEKQSCTVMANWYKIPRQATYIACAIRGRGEGNRQTLETGGSIANAVTTTQKDSMLTDGLRVRKLTERECFRLMNVSETDIDKIQAAGISRTQQYKMVGNSIVVAVLYHIFRKMFIETHCETRQLKLF